MGVLFGVIGLGMLAGRETVVAVFGVLMLAIGVYIVVLTLRPNQEKLQFARKIEQLREKITEQKMIANA